jgi:hypothetical protein
MRRGKGITRLLVRLHGGRRDERVLGAIAHVLEESGEVGPAGAYEGGSGGGVAGGADDIEGDYPDVGVPKVLEGEDGGIV